MAIYLQVRAGPLGILLDALRVHEVVVPEGLREDQVFAPWRDQVLRVVRLARHLELPGAQGQHAVVYSPSEGATPAMLMVDEVVRLRQLEASHWQPMPTVPVRTAALFDAVFLDDAVGLQLFRLRSELAPELLGVVEEALSAPEPS